MKRVIGRGWVLWLAGVILMVAGPWLLPDSDGLPILGSALAMYGAGEACAGISPSRRGIVVTSFVLVMMGMVTIAVYVGERTGLRAIHLLPQASLLPLGFGRGSGAFRSGGTEDEKKRKGTKK